jgi:cytochrome c-type biogenesis protein CcmH
MKYFIGIILALFITIVQALDIPLEHEDAHQQKRYLELIKELRCLVCQNQSLADSHSGLAQDLRNEVYKMVAEGLPDEEIINYLVTRYGDFVLFRPPLKDTTLVLWFGPFILLVVGILVVFLFVRSRNIETVSFTKEDELRVSKLLGYPEKTGKQ